MIQHQIKLQNWNITCANIEEARRITESLYEDKEYACNLETDSPNILDVGSHIGLAILYFKRRYPNAKIIGFEPNPNTFNFLKKNIQQNSISDINLINAGIASQNGESDFFIDANPQNPWAWGDSMVQMPWYDKDKYQTIKVKTVRLSEYINQKIDLLKIDAEGYESEILSEIIDKLHLVKYIAVEFHGSKNNSKNNFKHLVNLLKNHNFKVMTKIKTILLPSFLTMPIYNIRSKLSDNYQFLFHAKQV